VSRIFYIVTLGRLLVTLPYLTGYVLVYQVRLIVKSIRKQIFLK